MPVTLDRLSDPSTLGPVGHARLAAEILTTYVSVRRELPKGPILQTVGDLRAATSDESRPAGHATAYPAARRLGDAVLRTLPLLPTDTRCLVRSLVLTRMLARRGIASTLVIGVRTEPSFLAHAWVEHSGRAILPGHQGTFRRLAEL
jgi:hypothetical protein